MNTYILNAQDRMIDFEEGLRRCGFFDCVSEHRSRNRRLLMLGHSRAWTSIDDRELPVVIDWKAKIVIPAELAETVQAETIELIARRHLSRLSGRWVVDIRSEARMENYDNLGDLVSQDIERGDLPNRLVFNRGLQSQVLPQINVLRRRVGADPTFDWRRVRVDVTG